MLLTDFFSRVIAGNRSRRFTSISTHRLRSKGFTAAIHSSNPFNITYRSHLNIVFECIRVTIELPKVSVVHSSLEFDTLVSYSNY